MTLLNILVFKKLTKIHQWVHLRFINFIISASTLTPFYGGFWKRRNTIKGCFGFSMNWIFQNWLTFYLYALKHGRKKGKKNRKILKFSIFLGHPMFSTSVGTSKIRFWLFWKQILNSWYSNFQDQLLFWWINLNKGPYRSSEILFF